ncbi:actin nucleation-promoting factor WASL-like isoform X2 [Narcine bancroftii]|uniref:actin nucleation-promoting factor WASL-like isoform X2 n=1 Tax=Narcine bancroftii TaxID=1343680 RepID=UPI0038319F28
MRVEPRVKELSVPLRLRPSTPPPPQQFGTDSPPLCQDLPDRPHTPPTPPPGTLSLPPPPDRPHTLPPGPTPQCPRTAEGQALVARWGRAPTTTINRPPPHRPPEQGGRQAGYTGQAARLSFRFQPPPPCKARPPDPSLPAPSLNPHGVVHSVGWHEILPFPRKGRRVRGWGEGEGQGQPSSTVSGSSAPRPPTPTGIAAARCQGFENKEHMQTRAIPCQQIQVRSDKRQDLYSINLLETVDSYTLGIRRVRCCLTS